MSLGYAEKLSYHEDLGGQLGAPELFDADADARRKVAELAALVRAQRVLRWATWAELCCIAHNVWAMLSGAWRRRCLPATTSSSSRAPASARRAVSQTSGRPGRSRIQRLPEQTRMLVRAVGHATPCMLCYVGGPVAALSALLAVLLARAQQCSDWYESDGEPRWAEGRRRAALPRAATMPNQPRY